MHRLLIFVLLAAVSPAGARDDKDAQFHLKRGHMLAAQEKYQDAALAYGKAIRLDAKLADAYHLRGCVKFKHGDIAGSITDFDKYIELNPKAKISHWQRGISYYYAGRFQDGKRQFEGYQEFDNSDVENAVWRYLCMARSEGVAKARKAMLKIGQDTRVPMKEIYELFSGRLKPADVLAAAEADNPPTDKRNRQLFYAHLYLGLYFETEGDKTRALDHVTKAANGHRIGQYMWDVARVHQDILRKQEKK